MKKILFMMVVLVLGISALDALNTNNQEKFTGSDYQTEDHSFGTFGDACGTTKDIGKHATLVGWNLVKIPVIPLKHLILQVVDLFRAIKGTIKHSVLIGYSFIRLGGNLIAIPLIQGYEHPKEAAVFVAALLAAGGVYEGYILAQDLDPETWDSIIQYLNIFA